ATERIDPRRAGMQTYVILRRGGWQSPSDLEAAAERSTKVGDEEMSDDIRWIRSYVLEEDGGSVGTVCIYQASSPEAIRDHAPRAGPPASLPPGRVPARNRRRPPVARPRRGGAAAWGKQPRRACGRRCARCDLYPTPERPPPAPRAHTRQAWRTRSRGPSHEGA